LAPRAISDRQRWRPQFALRTRLGRRFVVLFSLCALVPVVVFGLLADRAVSRELTAQSQSRVYRAAKDASVSLLQQLQQIDGEFDRALRSGDAAQLPVRDDRIAALREIASADVSPALLTRIRSGKPAVRITPSGEAGTLQLLRAPTEDSTGMVIALDLRMLRMLGGVSGLDLVPPASRVCLTFDARELGCVAAVDAHQRGEAEAVGTASVFLRYTFGANDLRVRVAESDAVATAPLRRFRDLFIPIALTAVVLAALLAQVSIRRQTEPLAALKTGTQQIATGDFSHRVHVQSNDEFGELAQAFNGMTHRLDRQFNTLELRHDVDTAVLGASSRAAVIDVLLTRIRDVVQCQHAIMLVPVTDEGVIRLERWRVTGARRLGDPIDVQIPDSAMQALTAAGDAGLLIRADTRPAYLHALAGSDVYVLPISVAGTVHGILALGIDDVDAFHDEDRRRARQLVAQVAVAFSNVQLVDDLRALNTGALEALARTTDAASPWTAGHSVRVTAIAVALAKIDQRDAATVDLVRRGALLHDIGKIAVPVSILDKPGPLTDDERAIMSQHPVVGARILQPIAAFAPLMAMVRHHHEKWDGTGYPDRLAGDAIDPLARLLAVADVAESMLAARPYRAPLSVEFVTNFIRDNAGRHFDPHYAHLFADAVTRRDPELMAALAPYEQTAALAPLRAVA
jgi:putative nucleotidyltransferase with HDIG domain